MGPLSLSTTSTKFNLLSSHILHYCGHLPVNLASLLLTLYNPFSTQQTERSIHPPLVSSLALNFSWRPGRGVHVKTRHLPFQPQLMGVEGAGDLRRGCPCQRNRSWTVETKSTSSQIRGRLN